MSPASRRRPRVAVRPERAGARKVAPARRAGVGRDETGVVVERDAVHTASQAGVVVVDHGLAMPRSSRPPSRPLPRADKAKLEDTPGGSAQARPSRPLPLLGKLKIHRVLGGSATAPRKTSARGVPTDDDGPHGLEGPVPHGERATPRDEIANILQISEDYDDTSAVTRLLIDDFRHRYARRRDDEEWFAWCGFVYHHPKGLNFWVATSASVPVGVLENLAFLIGLMGFRKELTTGRPTGLSPLLYAGRDGIEILRTA